MSVRSIIDILESQQAISADQVSMIRKELRSTNKDAETILREQKVSEGDIVNAKSVLFGIPTKQLHGAKVPYEVLKYIPEESARQYKFVPLNSDNGVLEIGMVHPQDLEAREALQFISSGQNVPFKIFLISETDFNSVLDEYKGLGGTVTKALGELQSSFNEDKIQLPEKQSKEIAESVKDAPITKMVTVILQHALEGRASDVHIEPGKDRLRVRFRVDGVLYTSLFLPINVHEAIISRVKIMSNLKIDERRVPQDGRFRVKIGERDIDFRVSTFPTYFGEKTAIRILDPERGVKDLPSLGLEGRNLELVKKALKRPFGLILITGPTGSGKSTTLYGMMKLINQEKRNIVSLEDPIEYYIEGLNQSQTRPEIGYSFASGLRSVLRQDPDVIMVGEIRDKETAQLAIHAALTGHLVLSTLHTNNSIGVIPRLVDMGVDPFLIPSTLVLAMAQRLVRTLCEESRKEIPLSDKTLELIETEISGFPENARKKLKIPKVVYEALPSKTCPKGTRGRIAIFEALSMTSELEQIILKNPSESVIHKEASRQGMLTMRQDGIMKTLAGKIGLEALSEVAL